MVDQITVLAATDAPPLKSYLRHIMARQNHQTCEQLDRIKAPTLILVGEETTTPRAPVASSSSVATSPPASRMRVWCSSPVPATASSGRKPRVTP